GSAANYFGSGEFAARKSRRRTSSGSGALRPPPPVVAPLVPRCALLPAATPRIARDNKYSYGYRAYVYRSDDLHLRRSIAEEESREARPQAGGWGREGVRSEARAELRLAPGGRSLPRS